MPIPQRGWRSVSAVEEEACFSMPNLFLRYERILNRMNRNLQDAQWQIACQLLGWMVCAKRPLRWREIQAARSIDTTDQSFDFTNEKLRSEKRDYCGSLIQVLSGDRVELVHTTAKM